MPPKWAAFTLFRNVIVIGDVLRAIAVVAPALGTVAELQSRIIGVSFAADGALVGIGSLDLCVGGLVAACGGDVKYTARVMLLTVTCIRPVLALVGVYVCQHVLHRSDIALVAAWMATLCDMAVRMALMMKRYRSEKWHSIKV